MMWCSKVRVKEPHALRCPSVMEVGSLKKARSCRGHIASQRHPKSAEGSGQSGGGLVECQRPLARRPAAALRLQGRAAAVAGLQGPARWPASRGLLQLLGQ